MKLASRCKGSFSSDVRSRGEACFLSGRVVLLDVDEFGIEAQVAGSHRIPYHVSIELEGSGARSAAGSCTCPYYEAGSLCKHIWAVIRAFDEHQPHLAADGPAPAEVADNAREGLLGDSWDAIASVPHAFGDLGDDDDDEPEEEWLDSLHTPTGRRGGNGRDGNRGISWREQLQELVASPAGEGSPDFEKLWDRVAGRRREIVYVLDLAASQATGQLVVELFRRETKKNGQFGKPRAVRSRPDLLRSATTDEDQCVLRLMDVIAQGSSYGWWPYYHSYSGQVPIAAERHPAVLPRLCQTGRFRWRRSENQPVEDARQIAWDDGPPYRFRLEMPGDDARQCWLLRGSLYRGDERVPLEKPVLMLNSGVILFDDRMARFDAAGAPPWITLLQSHREIAIPYGDQGEFLRQLYTFETIPEIDLPPPCRLPEIACRPQPVLRIYKPKASRSSYELRADLLFDYEGILVPAADRRLRVLQEENQRLAVRDIERESECLARLAAWSVRPWSQTYNGPGGDLAIPAHVLDEIVLTLTREGWLVEAEGFRVRQPGCFRGSVTSGVDWFDLDGQFDYGDGVFTTLPDLLRAVREGQNFVRLSDGSRGMLPEQWLARFAALAELGTPEGAGVRFRNSQAALLDALLAAQDNVSVDQAFSELRDKLRSFTGIQPQAEPQGFSGDLRQYQREGLGWMDFLQSFRLGGCLADDMGLGKTVQVLALLERRRAGGEAAGPSLIVVPRSLVFNWIDEAARFTPQITIRNYTGLLRKPLLDDLQPGDVLVTTYGTLRRDILKLKEIAFDYTILDESQAIKNANSLAAKAARLLNARHRLALTGTPVENHLGELWSLFEFLNPGMLGRSTVFQRCWKNGRAEPEKVELLRAALAPFLLRRTKEKVLAELPQKTEQTLYCELDRQERKAYDQLRKYYREALQKKIDAGRLNQSKIQVLEALLRLRQAACHRGLLDPTHAAGSSAKLETLLEQLAEILAEGHKALVFSQFTSLLAIVREHLDRRGIVYEYLDGGTTNRGAKVRRFQEDADCPLFLISLKAGGHGLNLTAADYVFILDPWWNPAVEAQAVDRAHRIGQTRPVFAYRIIARDTVEEKILELQASKRNLAEAIISSDGSLIQRLTAEDLQLLLS